MLTNKQPTDTHGVVAPKPAIDGVGVTRFEQAMASDSMRRGAISDLEHGSTAFADEGPRIVVTILIEFCALGWGKL